MQHAATPSKPAPDVYSWQRALRSDTTLSLSTKAVALILSTYMLAKRPTARPSRETLMEDTGLSIAALKRYLLMLDEAGYIDRQYGGGRSKKTGHGITTTYLATIPTQPPNRPADEPVYRPAHEPVQAPEPAHLRTAYRPAGEQSTGPSAGRKGVLEVEVRRSKTPPTPPRQRETPSQALTSEDWVVYNDWAATVGSMMVESDRDRLNAEYPTYRHIEAMASEVVRLLAIGQRHALTTACTEPYANAQSVVAVLHSRVTNHGRRYSQPRPPSGTLAPDTTAFDEAIAALSLGKTPTARNTGMTFGGHPVLVSDEAPERYGYHGAPSSQNGI